MKKKSHLESYQPKKNMVNSRILGFFSLDFIFNFSIYLFFHLLGIMLYIHNCMSLIYPWIFYVIINSM